MHHVTPNTNEAVTDKSLFSPEKTGVLKCLLARTMLPRLGPFGYALLCLLLVMPGSLWAGNGEEVESTMLMFVGESLEVLSIASRREESAMQAPAIAEVITREDLRDRGITTLSQALSVVPGFYMAKKEWGALPYLRGLPNAALFLYDTVPLTSDTTKTLHQLDGELSLGPVKRIEIIRGPGSVLWGPDAFAGIVNVVPLTGKDLSGVETEVSYGGPGDQRSFSVHAGFDNGRCDGILSVSGREGEADDSRVNLLRYWRSANDIFPFDERFGDGGVADARYFDAYGRFSAGDVFSVSGRITESRTPYTIAHPDKDYVWQESRSFPGGFLKIESKLPCSAQSAMRLTGYYSFNRPEFEIIDRTFSQSEQSLYGELIYDRSFLSKTCLMTVGASYRGKWVDDARIWGGYLPDFLGAENDVPPTVRQEDYEAGLLSVFSQYSHKIGLFDLSAGIRFDRHEDYEDNVSFNTAVVWSPSSAWVAKMLYGTAYRTPYARQLFGATEPDLEKRQEGSIQVAWAPLDGFSLSVTGFASRIDQHVMEDPYAGISQPNHQNINGLEFSSELRFSRFLDVSANLTLLDSSGPEECYRYVENIFVRPDGSVEIEYGELSYAFDAGPDRLFNLAGTWRFAPDVTLYTALNYASSTILSFPRNNRVMTFSGQWTADMSIRIEHVHPFDLDLTITAKNLFDSRYAVPGVYSGIEGDHFGVDVILRKKW